MAQWFQDHEGLFWWLAALSAATFVATLILVPMSIVRIPPDYFMRRSRAERLARLRRRRHPVASAAALIGKNILGAVCLLAGLLMLALPGQGVLTMLVGVMLLNFPGKLRLERWIVSRGPILRSINWIRQRKGRPPLELGE